jgi:hypothetical protein
MICLLMREARELCALYFQVCCSSDHSDFVMQRDDISRLERKLLFCRSQVRLRNRSQLRIRDVGRTAHMLQHWYREEGCRAS